MQSFDVFDTLLARRYVTATPLFNQMESELRIANFRVRRVDADNGGRSLAEIYRAIDLPDAVMRREIELEVENAIPIRANLDRVEHGDLLLSDMYMAGQDILRMVRHVGMDKQVTIYQSNRGKSSGEVWRRLAARKPSLHVGDNAHSDFGLPQSLGFSCELYQGAGLTRNEAMLLDRGLAFLACLMREIRLGERRRAHASFFEVACQANLPWLFIAAELLSRKHSAPITFLGRDCQLLSRLFEVYYAPSHYTPFSRRVAYQQPAEAIAYLRAHLAPGGLLVDISSTGATWQHLHSGLPIETVIYSDQHHYTHERPVLPDGFSYLMRNSLFGQTNLLLEVFNCGDHGYLREIELIGPGLMRASYAPPQLDEALIEAMHAPVARAVALASVYRARIRSDLRQLPRETLVALFGELCMETCSQPSLMPQLGDYARRDKGYTDEFRALLAVPA